MDVFGGAILHGPRVVIVRDFPEYTPSRVPKPFTSPPPMLGSPVVGELGPKAGSQMPDVRSRSAHPPTFGSDYSPHFPGQSFSAGGAQPSMKANSATLGYFREGSVMYPWPAASSAEQHQNSPAEEGEKKKEVPGKRISAILGYELDHTYSKKREEALRKVTTTYYSQDRWKYVSDNFLKVHPEEEVDPIGCNAWIFKYSTDFLTSGMNWKNNRNEIMFHLRRDPDYAAPDRNRLVMNSCAEPSGFYKMLLGAIGIPQSWGLEEHVWFSPADVGDNIQRQIVVCVDDAGFHVAWDGKVQYTFEHRLPWPSFKNFEVDPEWVKKPDSKYTEGKSTTLQSMLTTLHITCEPVSTTSTEKNTTLQPVLQRMLKSMFSVGQPKHGNKPELRVARWEGKQRKLSTVEDNHQSKVKVGNIKEFICSVLDVRELSKQEFDKWYNLRRTHQWHTIFPVISSNSKEKHDILKVARQNCEVLLTLHEEKVLLELVLENSKPLLVCVVFSGVIRQYAREERSRNHRRASSADVLAAALESLACSIVHRVQLTELFDAAGSQHSKPLREHMDEVLGFAITHRMKAFISEPVIIALVNSKWSDTNFLTEFLKSPYNSRLLSPYQYESTAVQCFLIPFALIHVFVWVLPIMLLFSSWAPAWRFWTFQASYLTYAMLAWYLPLLCTSIAKVGLKKSGSRDWRNACLDNGKADDDCCGYMQNTSCAAGFRKSVNTDSMVCHEDADGVRYSTCCLPSDPDSAALEVAVVVMLVTHIWAEVAQQFRIARRVEFDIKETLWLYTHDIWNILDTAALFTAAVADVTRACLLGGVRSLPPATTADIQMYAIVLGFLRFMTLLQVFEFSGPLIYMVQVMILGDFTRFVVITICVMLPLAAALNWRFEGSSAYYDFQTTWWFFMQTFVDAGKGPSLDDNSAIGKSGASVVWTAYALLVIVMANLLIAMFSKTFDLVFENARQQYFLKRAELLLEWEDAPQFPPPFNVPCDLLRVCRRLAEWFCCKEEAPAENTVHDSGEKNSNETGPEFPNTEFPYDQNDLIAPQPEKRREWIQQVLKDLEEGEQGTEEQLNQFKYLVMKRLIRSEKNMEEVTKNIDALRQEVTQLLEQLNKKL